MTPPVRPVPSWMEWIQPDRLGVTRRGEPRDASRVATQQQKEYRGPSLGSRIRESAGRIGRQVVERPVQTVADMLPGIGDAIALKDAVGAAQEGDWPVAGMMAASVLPMVPNLRGPKALAHESSRLAERLRGESALRGLDVVERPTGIRGWHGSPYQFDRFSMDKIGTGEGAQVYGHGLYFAEAKPTAESYRDVLSRDRPGSLYEVELDVDPDNAMLRWFDPSEQQPDLVREAVADINPNALSPRNLGYDYEAGRMAQAPRSGSEIYQELVRTTGSPQSASQALRDRGVHGVQYPDQLSRRKRSGGTRNFVLYDEDRVNILKRYGLAGLLALTATQEGEGL